MRLLHCCCMVLLLLMHRMVQAVNNAAVSPQAERSDAGAVRALVDVIKNEEVAIVINLDDRIQVYI